MCAVERKEDSVMCYLVEEHVRKAADAAFAQIRREEARQNDERGTQGSPTPERAQNAG